MATEPEEAGGAESVEGVLTEFGAFLNDAAATYGIAIAGLGQLSAFLKNNTPPAENPDPSFYFGVGDPNDPSSRKHARLRRSDVMRHCAPGGLVWIRLGQQWAVSVFTGWEHEYRPRLAQAHGCNKDDLLYPLLGDLRLIRHDIVHRKGVATIEHTGKCEVLHWFQPGDEIRLGGEQIGEFLEQHPWDAMRVGPGST